MKKRPTKVKLVGKEKSNYKIKFPYLKIPVIVNEYMYRKMLNETDEYYFVNS